MCVEEKNLDKIIKTPDKIEKNLEKVKGHFKAFVLSIRPLFYSCKGSKCSLSYRMI